MVAEVFLRRRSHGRGNSGVTIGKILINTAPMFRRTLPFLALFVSLSLARAGTDVAPVSDCVIVSVKDQRLMLVQGGSQVAVYPVSTSKFGIAIRNTVFCFFFFFFFLFCIYMCFSFLFVGSLGWSCWQLFLVGTMDTACRSLTRKAAGGCGLPCFTTSAAWARTPTISTSADTAPTGASACDSTCPLARSGSTTLSRSRTINSATAKASSNLASAGRGLSEHEPSRQHLLRPTPPRLRWFTAVVALALFAVIAPILAGEPAPFPRRCAPPGQVAPPIRGG